MRVLLHATWLVWDAASDAAGSLLWDVLGTAACSTRAPVPAAVADHSFPHVDLASAEADVVLLLLCLSSLPLSLRLLVQCERVTCASVFGVGLVVPLHGVLSLGWGGTCESIMAGA
jgi:hypothetical protein